jgi:hypothetical protein
VHHTIECAMSRNLGAVSVSDDAIGDLSRRLAR